MAKKKDGILTLPVSYGTISVGDKTARIGLTIGRGNLEVVQADRHFTDKRLTCKITARPNGEAPGQTALPGMDNTQELQGVADVKGIKVTGNAIAIGLTFVIRSIDLEKLTHFAKREGDLTVTEVEKIPDDEQGQPEEE